MPSGTSWKVADTCRRLVASSRRASGSRPASSVSHGRGCLVSVGHHSSACQHDPRDAHGDAGVPGLGLWNVIPAQRSTLLRVWSFRYCIAPTPSTASAPRVRSRARSTSLTGSPPISPRSGGLRCGLRTAPHPYRRPQQRIEAKGLHEVLAERIFEPLGMTDTRFFVSAEAVPTHRRGEVFRDRRRYRPAGLRRSSSLLTSAFGAVIRLLLKHIAGARSQPARRSHCGSSLLDGDHVQGVVT